MNDDVQKNPNDYYHLAHEPNDKLLEQMTFFREGKPVKDEVIKIARETSKKYLEYKDSVVIILKLRIRNIVSFWKEGDREKKWPSSEQEYLQHFIDFCKEKEGFINELDEFDQASLKRKTLAYKETLCLYDKLRAYRKTAEEFLEEIQSKQKESDPKTEPDDNNIPPKIRELLDAAIKKKKLDSIPIKGKFHLCNDLDHHGFIVWIFQFCYDKYKHNYDEYFTSKDYIKFIHWDIEKESIKKYFRTEMKRIKETTEEIL